MRDPVFEVLASRHTPRCVLWSDPPSGLRAVLVIDNWVLGPAVGGTRTLAYDSLAAAVDDAANLARAMTLKCSLGGITAGGAKIVVIEHPDLDRAAGFARLGQFVGEFDGRVITAGDLGTTVDDLVIMAEHCRNVHTGEADLARSVARGLLRCIEACAKAAEKPVAGLRVAVQGCGAIGAAAARQLAAADVELIVADLDDSRARAVADELRASVAHPRDILAADVDIVSPCAIGGVLTVEAADALNAWAVCGAANNIIATVDAERRLADRGILHVPDVISSAGAVVDGVGELVMGLADRTALIDALGDTARRVLDDSRRTGTLTSELAEQRAWARIEAARADSYEAAR